MAPEGSEEEWRKKIVIEAESWIGTPYLSNALVKGKRGGTDCAMLFIGIYGNLGLVPKEFDPRPYPAMWHMHRNEEKYLGYIQQYMLEIPEPAVRSPLPADLVLFKIGHVFAHGAIVTNWPMVIHAVGNDRVLPDDISRNTTGKRALAIVPQRAFSLWEPKT